MGDWPQIFTAPQSNAFGPWTQSSLTGDMLALSTANIGAAVWPAANRALFYPVWVEQPALAQKIGVWVTTQSGNLDVGIYAESGARLVSMGSTAVAAAGLQVLDITDTRLNPGIYYVALCVDNVTAAFERSSNLTANMLRVCGVRQQDVGVVTLPATATFANMASPYVVGVTVQCASVM